MGTGDEARRELGGFLRKRREQLLRADFALPPVGRSRTSGLRREEIAYHAGVSVTWYTWLEQGRGINPSRHVLDAVARTLRLTAEEHEYVLALAGYAPERIESQTDVVAAPPPHVRRLLDSLDDAPAFAVAPDWSIVAWNGAYEALYPNVATVASEDRNLLAFVFTDPDVRRMLPDWETTSRHFLAEYRAEAGQLLGGHARTTSVERLMANSAEFANAWNEHRVERFASRERVFDHPRAGRLVFEHHRLTPTDVPDLHVVIYLPQDADTRAKLRSLRRRRPS